MAISAVGCVKIRNNINKVIKFMKDFLNSFGRWHIYSVEKKGHFHELISLLKFQFLDENESQLSHLVFLFVIYTVVSPAGESTYQLN